MSVSPSASVALNVPIVAPALFSATELALSVKPIGLSFAPLIVKLKVVDVVAVPSETDTVKLSVNVSEAFNPCS